MLKPKLKQHVARKQENQELHKPMPMLDQMAYTILGAAVTTALASVLLLSCKIILFRQIGTVLTLNAAIGFLVAIFLFSSLACLLRSGLRACFLLKGS